MPPFHDPLPRRRKSAEHLLIDRFDLVPELRERSAAQHAEHAGIGPLAPRAARAELAFDQPSLDRQAREHGFGRRGAEAVPHGEVRRREGRVRARVPEREVAERIANRLEQRLGDADRQRNAEGVAEARRIFDGDEARIAGDADRQDTARGGERPHARGDVHGDRSLADFVFREIPERQEHVVDAVGALHVVLRIQPLKLPLDRVHRLRVEQLAELGVAEQVAQLRLVDRERLRAAFGERRVAVVDEARHVAEEQRRGEGRWRLGINGGEPDLPAAQVGQRRDERRHVEEIAQALAVRLEQHRKRSVTRGDGEQIGGALALLPQRRPHPGPPLRQEQRSRGVLAKLRREQRGRAELPHHQRLHFVRIRDEQPRIGRLIDIRKPHDEPVVSPQRFDVGARFLADLRGRRHRPRRVNPAAARREDAHPPVAQLVAHALDDDGGRVGDGACRRHLIAEVLQQVLGGAHIQIVLARQPIHGSRRRQPQQVVHQAADGEPELQGAAGAIAFPERHLARLAGRRRDDHAVVRDLHDAPRRGAEHERLAGAALEHHLLVELAHARGARCGAEEENAIEAAIGNRSPVRDRDALRAFPRADRAGHAVPGDARPQLGEFVGRIAARQHVEHPLEHRAAELGERRGAADRGEQRVDLPVVH